MSSRLAAPLGEWARRGDVRFASHRLCVYGLTSRSGATTIQSYKNGAVFCINEYSLQVAVQ